MKPEHSPFRPGQPADLELFVGRAEQISRVTQLVTNAAHGRFQIAFLTGERGIGKTSLASFARYLAERDETAATSHVFLGDIDAVDRFVHQTLEHIVKDNVGKPWYKNIVQIFGERVDSIGLFNVSIKLRFTPDDMHAATNSFPQALRTIQTSLAQERATLFIVLDDIDSIAQSSDFAHWLKSMVDTIAIDQTPTNVTLLLVGLEEARRSLITLQPSLARVFDVIDVQPWNQQESEDFFRKCFDSVDGSIDADALLFMTQMTGGLPVVAHEIGDAVYRLAVKYPVDMDVAIRGTLRAAEAIGHKILQPQIVEALRSAEYREILRTLPKQPLTHEFRRSELIERLPPDSGRAVSAFLRRMRGLGAITQDPERGRGAYRFTNPAYYLYFWLQSYSVRNGPRPHV